MKIDHVVFNAKTELDELETMFGRLGFTLSPRAFHSLGSMNHVAMFRQGYLELIGVPPERPDARPEVSQSRTGIDGVVFRTEDADATRETLLRLGLHPTDVQEFSRPVEVDGTTEQARFRTVRLERSPFTGGRVYFCQHLTPELVWQRGMLEHPNESQGIREVVVVSADPTEQARRFAGLAGSEAELVGHDVGVNFGDCRVRIVSPRSYQQTYGVAALSLPEPAEFFGAVVIECDDPARAVRDAAMNGWLVTPKTTGATCLASPRHRILIEFTTPWSRQ